MLFKILTDLNLLKNLSKNNLVLFCQILDNREENKEKRLMSKKLQIKRVILQKLFHEFRPERQRTGEAFQI
jgi:hypothetical protein